MRSRLLQLIGVTVLITSVLMIPSATALTDGTVAAEQKISDLQGGFGPGLDNYDDFARSIANIGDFDGDGVTDIAVGQTGDDDAGGNAGALWLVYLNADGTVKATTKIVPNQANMPGGGANFGVSVTSLGDMDGDGVTDLAVGNQRENGGRGAVWILFMNSDGTVKAHQKIGQGLGGFSGSLQGSANFGFATTNMGDLDGNGVIDLAVGAPTEVNGTGEVWILFMNSNGTVMADQEITNGVGGFTGSLASGDQFGEGVANTGDLNNDGVVDLAVAAQLDDDGGPDRGALYVLFMNANGTVASHQKVSSTAGGLGAILDNYDKFGTSVAAMGDLDGDGAEDLVVGGFDSGNEGAVWLLFMNTNGTVASTQRISEGVGGFVGPTDPGDLFGWSVAGIGDFNSDGSTDLAVGALRDDDGGPDRGAVWMLFLEPLPTTGSIDGFKFLDIGGSGNPSDGALDIVFLNRNQQNRVCIGDGSGGFTCSDLSTATNNSFRAAIGHVNGDPYPDVVVANYGNPNQVCFGDGSGAFSCNNVSSDANMSRGVSLGLIDGDSHLDAIFVNQNQPNRLCRGDGSGSFTCSDATPESNASMAVALGFVDGDTNLDAVISNGGQPNRACLGDGLGGFTCTDVSTRTDTAVWVALGHANSDGHLDAVFPNNTQHLNRVCLGDGTGGFTCSDVSGDANNTNGVALGYIDGDPNLDVVFANYDLAPQNKLCLGDGSGGFSCGNVSSDPYRSVGVALGDFDSDANLDAVFNNTSGQRNRVCFGDGAGGFSCTDVSGDGFNTEGVAVGDLGGSRSPGMAGVTFTLAGTTTGGDPVGPVTATTNASGEFSFEDLDPGTYTITETVPFGLVSSTHDPGDPSVVVTVGAGELAVAFAGQVGLGSGEFETVVPGLAFGNKPNTDPALGVDTDPVLADEGSPATNSGTIVDGDGDVVAMSATVGTVTNNGDGTWGWSFETDDGPVESQVVSISADDGNGGTDSVDFTLTVTNVAPVGVFGDDGPAGEGSAFTLSLTAPFDPSDADTLAGFEYAFDCGDGAGLGAFGSSASAVCPTDDDGARSVVGQIRDIDGGLSEYTAAVTVDNVAPVGVFGDDGPVDEGSPFTLSLTSPFDPSPVDSAAGFAFAFDCGDGSGLGAFGPASTAACATMDDALLPVAGHVRDKDGAVSMYTGTAAVNNVPPVAEIWAVLDDNGDLIGLEPHPGLLALPVDLAGNLVDVGLEDTHVAQVDWGDGDVGSFGAVEVGETFYAQHSYFATGAFTLEFEVTDDDGGTGTDTFPIAIVDLGGAIGLGSAELTALAASPDVDPAAVAHINDAIDRLAEATEKWDLGKAKSAVSKVRRALIQLDRAEDDDNDLYVVHIEAFLARGAKSAAQYAIHYATSIDADPQAIADATALVNAGDVAFGTEDFADAALHYGDAVGVVDEFLDDPPPDLYSDGEVLIQAQLDALGSLEEGVYTPAAERLLDRASNQLGEALEDVAEDKPAAAIGHLRSAVKKLERAEGKDATLDLTSIMDGLAGAGSSLANDAADFATDMARVDDDFIAIDAAVVLIASGDALRAADDYAGALTQYRSAVQQINYLI
ncbi:MAG: hypothetical protein GY720_00285 [bacterium]|nr:hypothetical protein [bacterium]